MCPALAMSSGRTFSFVAYASDGNMVMLPDDWKPRSATPTMRQRMADMMQSYPMPPPAPPRRPPIIKYDGNVKRLARMVALENKIKKANDRQNTAREAKARRLGCRLWPMHALALGHGVIDLR